METGEIRASGAAEQKIPLRPEKRIAGEPLQPRHWKPLEAAGDRWSIGSRPGFIICDFFLIFSPAFGVAPTVTSR